MDGYFTPVTKPRDKVPKGRRDHSARHATPEWRRCFATSHRHLRGSRRMAGRRLSRAGFRDRRARVNWSRPLKRARQHELSERVDADGTECGLRGRSLRAGLRRAAWAHDHGQEM